MYATLQIKQLHFLRNRLFPLSQTRSFRRTRVWTFHYNTSLNKMIQLYLKKIKKSTVSHGNIRNIWHKNLMNCLCPFMQAFTWMMEVYLLKYASLLNYDLQKKETPLQTTSRTFMQNNRVHKKSVRVITCCRNFGFIIWTTTSLKINYKD